MLPTIGLLLFAALITYEIRQLVKGIQQNNKHMFDSAVGWLLFYCVLFIWMLIPMEKIT